MLKVILIFIWKVYKGLCLIIGTFVLLYPALIFYILQSKQTYLPNGLFLERPSLFSEYEDIWLWKPDGSPVFEGAVDSLCFNEDYIYAISYWDYEMRIIYSLREDKLWTSNHPEFYDIYRGTKLSGSDGCAGHLRYLAGATLLLKDPSILRGDAPRYVGCGSSLKRRCCGGARVHD